MNHNEHDCPAWDEDDGPSPKDDPLQEIYEETASYTQDFARSNEDGWFYSDQEEVIDAIPDHASEDD